MRKPKKPSYKQLREQRQKKGVIAVIQIRTRVPEKWLIRDREESSEYEGESLVTRWELAK